MTTTATRAPVLRLARAEDAEAVATILRRSIAELCAADHHGEAAALGPWLANKTPEQARAWIDDPGQRLVLAEIDGRPAGVASANGRGEILLNYVSPDFVRRGAGSAMLADLEAWLRRIGVTEARLDSTATARDFYLAQGYRVADAPHPCCGVEGFPMKKPLARTALVIFDCDGVLVDSEPIALRLLLETLSEAGLSMDLETATDRFLGRSLASTRTILAEEFRVALTDAALEAMRLRLYAAFRAELDPIPGVAEILPRLGAPVCVASSSSPERIALSLEVTGLLPAFRGHIFSASEVANGKPAPDLFLHAAARMGADPGACLVVEDSPAGVTAGKAAGMRVVGFVGGAHAGEPAHRRALEALAPDAIIADMRDLPGLL